jgi:hypothetical protein
MRGTGQFIKSLFRALDGEKFKQCVLYYRQAGVVLLLNF